jgi:hypothetical protein
MRTHADGGKIFKTTSDIVVCCPKFGMALACPLPVAHIEGHCQEVGAAPGMPMSTPFILSARSKDLELKGIKTVRIPEYNVEDDAGATGSRASTQSGHGSEVSSRASSPSGDGAGLKESPYGGKSAGDKASVGLGMAPPAGYKTSHIDFGGGSAASGPEG